LTGAELHRSIYLPPWRIDITRRPTAPRLLPATNLARLIAEGLAAAGAPAPAAVGLTLTDDVELARLNARHLGKTGPTDVLSFPLLEAPAFPPHLGQELRSHPQPMADFRPPGNRAELGDIVVSVERAIEQADSARGGQTGDVAWSPADELRLLVIHGTLHICGWDHRQPEEEAAMRALERHILGLTHD
jgi:probable rRNA maturation factor